MHDLSLRSRLAYRERSHHCRSQSCHPHRRFSQTNLLFEARNLLEAAKAKKNDGLDGDRPGLLASAELTYSSEIFTKEKWKTQREAHLQCLRRLGLKYPGIRPSNRYHAILFFIIETPQMFPLNSRNDEASDAVVSPPLSQAVGYVVVVVVGLIIAFGMLGISSWLSENLADLSNLLKQ